jgi:hypothetical protein
MRPAGVMRVEDLAGQVAFQAAQDLESGLSSRPSWHQAFVVSLMRIAADVSQVQCGIGLRSPGSCSGGVGGAWSRAQRHLPPAPSAAG